MRVGFDVTLAARVTTGVGVYARELEPALLARGLDLQHWEHPIGPAGRRWGRIVNGLRLAGWQAHGCARRAAREHVHLVHATAAVGPRGLSCPLVMTIHDATTVTMPLQGNPADRLFQRVFAVDAARRADAVLTPSRTAAADVTEHYGVPAARVRVVPLGVSDRFRHVTPEEVVRVRTTYALDRPYVLYVGADAPRKNLRTLVHAIARGPATLREVDIVIVGPRGPRDAALDADALAVGLPRPIRRLGTVSADLLPAVYAGAGCVAYVSLYEGFGLPVVEAMAAGAPVVTSARSSMEEVAGDAALLVDPTSPEAIGDAVARVLDDTALAARLRELGLRRSAQFDWATTARLTHEVYRDVCGVPRPLPASAPTAARSVSETGTSRLAG